MATQFEELMEKFLAETIKPDEIKMFVTQVAESGNEEYLREILATKIKSREYTGLSDRAKDMDALFRNMLSKAEEMENEETKIAQLVPSGKRYNIGRWAVAASIILALGIGTYFLFFNNGLQQPGIVKTTVRDDVGSPQANRAMITLANGQKVYLDSVGNGQLAMQTNVALLKKQDGKIVYVGSSITTDRSQLMYNTLYNPRGSKVIDMTLTDGSHVWLNAGSSITFPVAFSSNERKVTMTGEAYFEIEKDAKRRFIVDVNGVVTEVLGTHFNVNAYDDEDAIRVTLLEGSVKVSQQTTINNPKSVTLRSGEQAVNKTNSPLTIDNAPDLEQVMAWKNEKFYYNNTDLETIMRQMARWYDVEVDYKDKINDRYTVDVPRNVPVSQLFKFIEMSGGVRFEIVGRKILVTK